MSPDPVHAKASARGLLTRKLLVGFAIGFLSYFLPSVLDILDSLRDGQDFSIGWSLLISLVSGGVGAGVRALLALGPWNLAGPTDALHTIGSGDRPSKVTVTEPTG